MKLISMTDFVLCEDVIFKEKRKFKDLVLNYANFLKQLLELWMFVPCDEDGNVLEEPKWENEETDYEIQILVQEYQQAKEKCLFEGFEVIRTFNLEKENPCYVVSNGEKEVTFHIGLYNFSEGVMFAKTIEDLTPISPQLSQTAIKQLNK
jgi:hypothetical protein